MGTAAQPRPYDPWTIAIQDKNSLSVHRSHYLETYQDEDWHSKHDYPE